MTLDIVAAANLYFLGEALGRGHSRGPGRGDRGGHNRRAPGRRGPDRGRPTRGRFSGEETARDAMRIVLLGSRGAMI